MLRGITIEELLKKSSVVILIGGKSSRMGYKDKYNLKIGQKRFIDYIIEELNSIEYIVISANKNEDLENLNNKVIIDEIDEIGPIGGI